MVLVHPSIDREKGLLKLSIPSAGIDGLHVPLEPTAEDLASWPLLDDVRIWSDTVDAYVVDAPAVHEALSSFLDRTVKLVMKGPSRRALASPAAKNPDVYALPAPLPDDARTAFADGFPFLLVTTWSAQDVERKVALSASGDEQWAVKPPLEGEAKRKWAAGEDDYLRRTRGNLVVSLWCRCRVRSSVAESPFCSVVRSAARAGRPGWRIGGAQLSSAPRSSSSSRCAAVARYVPESPDLVCESVANRLTASP
jgi:hypothetical protein